MTTRTPPRLAALSKALAAALACSASAAYAGNTIPVTSCADDGSAGTLRAVLANDAQSGDTLDLSGLVGGSSCGILRIAKINLGSDGELATALDDITLRGVDGHPETITISGAGQSRVLHHTGAGTIHVESLTIADGAASGADVAGACIESSGSVTLLDAKVSGCAANGTTRNRGAGVFAVGQLELTHSTVSDSHTIDGVQGLGGGIYAYAALMTDSTISGNSASVGGGAYLNGYFRVERSTFTENKATTSAGALVSGPNAYAPMIVSSTISGNSAQTVGGMLVSGDGPTISNSTIAFNHSETDAVGANAVAAGLAVGYGVNAIATLVSTIVANNTATAANLPTDISIREGSGAVLMGEHNLVMTVDEVPATIDSVITVTADPMLGPLQKNGGSTLTHVPAWNGVAIGVGSNPTMLTSDQRGEGFPRSTPAGKTDVGAVQNDTIFRDGVDPAV
jgi:hypothetical protein